MKHPQSLFEATRLFSTKELAHDYLVGIRWPDGVIPCPTCGSTEHWFLSNQLRWKCKMCKRQFSAKVGTIFEDSPIGLDKWLIATWLITNAKNGISSCELSRALEVTQKSAWFMLHRIRAAMQNGTFEKIGGTIEVDETFIGGKARNMHKSVKARKITVRGGSDKSVVVGMLERGGEVRAFVTHNREKATLNAVVKAHVERGSSLYSDEWAGYYDMREEYQHQVINHAQAYVDGVIHTNGMENFWSLLKRGLNGTYVSVEPFHLFRYLDEQMFRYNERKATDGQRFNLALSQVAGKRVTYSQLTGKELAAAG